VVPGVDDRGAARLEAARREAGTVEIRKETVLKVRPATDADVAAMRRAGG
jgi:hypothetical protein